MARHLRDLELYGTTGLELSDNSSIANKSTGADVLDLEANEVRSSQLAVDREVEQREVSCRGRHLKRDAD